MRISVLKKHSFFILLFFFFLIAYLILGFQKYNRFETGEDLAIYCQAIWNYSQFKPPFVSIAINSNIWNNRFGPAMAFLAPLFWLWQDARVLILIQQIIVVLGVFPFYLLAKKYLLSQLFSLIISFLYLYFIGIQSAVVADFHGATLTATFFSFTLYFLETKRWKIYWFFAFLTMLWKEDSPLLIFALGIYLGLIKKEKSKAIITSSVAFLYFWAINNLFLPLLNQQPLKFSFNVGKGEGILDLFFTHPFDFLKTFFYPPVKIRNIFLTLFSFGFLPLFSPFYWLVAPFTFLRFFSDPARYSLHFHYTATLTPILAFSLLLVLKKIKNNIIGFFFLALALIGTFYTNKPNLDPGFPTPPIAFIFKRAFFVLPPRNKDYETILSLIPKNSSVSAQAPLLAHLCFRNHLYLFPQNYQDSDYIALTFTESPYPLNSEEYEELKEKLLHSPNFEKLYFSYAGVLLKRIN